MSDDQRLYNEAMTAAAAAKTAVDKSTSENRIQKANIAFDKLYILLEHYAKHLESGGLDQESKSVRAMHVLRIAQEMCDIMKTAASASTKTYPHGATLSNGNCFFSAIYRASREQAVLDTIGKCLEISVANETEFIQAFRNKIADHIAAGHLPTGMGREGALDTYNVLIEMKFDPQVPERSGNSYKERVQSYPLWFRKKFGERGEKLESKKVFTQLLSEEVRKDGNWVSEIEVTIAKEMLNMCNINVRILNTNKVNEIHGGLQLKADGKTVLNLWNQGESHYVYFTMGAPPKTFDEISAEMPNVYELPALPSGGELKRRFHDLVYKKRGEYTFLVFKEFMERFLGRLQKLIIYDELKKELEEFNLLAGEDNMRKEAETKMFEILENIESKYGRLISIHDKIPFTEQDLVAIVDSIVQGTMKGGKRKTYRRRMNRRKTRKT
jgi:hypothetical protein